MDEYFCKQLRQPIYVSGKQGNPSIGYRLGGKGGRIGRVKCPKGLVVDIGDIDVSDPHSTDNMVICQGKHCSSAIMNKHLYTTFFLIDKIVQKARILKCFSLITPFFWLCGDHAYKIVPDNVSGVCALVTLVPAAYVSENDIDASYQLRTVWNHKEKRELFDAGDMTWSMFPSFTGWGVVLMERLN